MKLSISSHLLLIVGCLSISTIHVHARCSQYWIQNIFIEGNKHTEPKIILRELPFQINDVITIEQWKKKDSIASQQLYNTELFTEVNLRFSVSDSIGCEGAVVVIVKERWYTFPIVIAQLADRNFNEWWQTYNHDLKRINIGGWLYQRNLTGNNDNLLIGAQFGFARKMILRYSYSGIDKKQKWSAEYSLYYAKDKRIAYITTQNKLKFIYSDDPHRKRFFTGLTLYYRPDITLRHILDITYHRMSISDSVYSLNPDYLGNNKQQNYFTVYYSLRDNRTNNKMYPTNGLSYMVEITKYGILPRDDINAWSMKLTANIFYPINKRLYTAHNFITKYTHYKDVLPYYTIKALGYMQEFVRGYELYIIDGGSFVLNRNTLKYKIFEKTFNNPLSPVRQFRKIPIVLYTKVYGDHGYVWPSNLSKNNFLQGNSLYGYGLGLDINTFYSITMRLEYSWNQLHEHGFFIHMRLDIGNDMGHTW